MIHSELLRTTVLSVMNDEGISANVSRMQKQMLIAPGNRGGADIIMEYYEKISR